jgi:hypothetical protein
MVVENEKKKKGRTKGEPTVKQLEKKIQKRRELREHRAVQRRLKAKHKKLLKKRKVVLGEKADAAISEYFKCFNKTRAYTRFYGTTPNASELAYQFFKQGKIKEEIARRLADMRPEVDEVLVMFHDRGQASIEDFTTYDETTGRLVYDDVKAEASGKKHHLKEIEFGEFGFIKKIKIADQEYSLDKVAKALKMYTDEPTTPTNTIQSGCKQLQKLLDEVHEKDGSGNNKRK